MASFKDLNTRDSANEGIKIPLTMPDGSETDDFIVIRSIDSDAFRDAEIDGRRAVLRAAEIDDLDERRRLAKESTLNMQVALIKDWSFDEPCTEENIREFLTLAPHIADAIDQLATKRKLFVVKKSTNSDDSQEDKPN